MSPKTRSRLFWGLSGVATVAWMMFQSPGEAPQAPAAEGAAPAASAPGPAAQATIAPLSENEVAGFLNYGTRLKGDVLKLTVGDICAFSQVNAILADGAAASDRNQKKEFRECTGRRLSLDFSLMLAGAVLREQGTAGLNKADFCGIKHVATIAADLSDAAHAKQPLPTRDATLDRVNNLDACDDKGRWSINQQNWESVANALVLQRFYPAPAAAPAASAPASAASGPS